MNTALKTRAKLSVEQVIEIFQNKGTTATSSAAVVARQYGVSEKTVRDIWKGRTWCGETWHLDTSRVVQTKRIGRPKGCKDSKPRKPKADGRDEASCSPPDHLVGGASAASGQSVDQQLHEWGRALWLDFESADPFRRDWNPQPSGNISWAHLLKRNGEAWHFQHFQSSTRTR